MKLSTQDYSKKKIAELKKGPYPRVLLNVCTHGNELVGLKVASHFKKSKILKGIFEINVANERAVKEKKRFIDHDLNRIFPGRRKGSYEERLAHTMRPYIKAFDLVIDVHSTESGLRSSIIVTKLTPFLKPLIKAAAPKYLIVMKATQSNALISDAKNGVAFEYGKDKDPRTYKDTVQSIERVLHSLEMLPGKRTSQNKRVIAFEAYKTFEKPEGFVVDSKIKNFVLAPKGILIGRNNATGKTVVSKTPFYPILFGKNTYKTIFGFMGRRIKDL